MKNNNTISVMHIASGDLWAGAEVQLFTLTTSLIKQENIVICVVLLNHGTLEQKLLKHGIDVTVLDESALNGFQILLRLISIVHKINPDIIHTHRVKENILGSISALFNNVITIRTAHGAPEHKPAWFHIAKRLILFTDWICARVLQRKIVAVSEDLAEILKHDLPADKIIVIENGIDLTALTAKSKTPFAEYEATFRVGIAGRLVPVKRVDIFIKAAAELLNAHPELNISFHVFGDGPLKAELVDLNRKLKTGNRIHFEGHCENMRRELAKLDMLLITSDHEGLPMILLEAMALKTPVIAHAVGGIPNVLNHGKSGILISNQLPSAYTDAIFKLITDPITRNNYTQNALIRVTTLYSSVKNAKSYSALYRQLTA